jgi:hypothetical protein
MGPDETEMTAPDDEDTIAADPDEDETPSRRTTPRATRSVSIRTSRRRRMTWSVSAQGHHKTDTWREAEYELLRSLVEAVEADEDAVVSGFSFNGNNVSATSIEDAHAKLEAYDAEDEGETKET